MELNSIISLQNDYRKKYKENFANLVLSACLHFQMYLTLNEKLKLKNWHSLDFSICINCQTPFMFYSIKCFVLFHRKGEWEYCLELFMTIDWVLFKSYIQFLKSSLLWNANGNMILFYCEWLCWDQLKYYLFTI